MNSISDFSLNLLDSYIQDPDFKPEIIVAVNKPASLLCKWILIAYEFGKLNSQVYL